MSNRRNFLRQAGIIAFSAAGYKLFGKSTSATSDLFITPSCFKKRIFVAGFAHETNTFHPVPTTEWEFSVPENFSLDIWKDAGYEIVPGINAYPVGGGMLAEAPCQAAMDRILNALKKAIPVNAVFLSLHGAMFAEGIGHAETVLTGKIREMVGPGIPVACTFDLHGNIPARLGEYGNILVGLKTAPHEDMKETAEHAGKILMDTLAGKLRPVSYVLPIPFIVQGEKAMTTSEPFGSLVNEARRIEKEGIPGFKNRILAATLFAGCAWTDAPATGMSVMITADGSVEAAHSAAVYLAKKIWDSREQFRYGCETAELEEGVTKALNAKEKTVFLTDSGDNVTASTPGDLPLVLRHIVERNLGNVVVAGINDPVSMKKCFDAGEDKKVQLSIGAWIEKRQGPPFEAVARVVKLLPLQKMAVIKINGVEVILTDKPVTFSEPEQFIACGINPLERKIVVVKMGYLFPGLRKIAPRYIMLMTPGAGDMRIEKLTYTRVRRPIFPLDKNTPFVPTGK